MKSHRSNFGVVFVILLAASVLLLACYTQAMFIRSQANRRDFSHQSLHLPSKQLPGSSAHATGRAPDRHV